MNKQLKSGRRVSRGRRALLPVRSFIAATLVSCAAATSANSTAERAFPLSQSSSGDWTAELFRAGVLQDFAGANQLAALRRLLATLSESQRTTLRDLLLAATTPIERFFILKALVAGEPWDRVVHYALDIRGLDEDEIVSQSTVRGQQTLPQQWHYSCGPAVAQVALAELDPVVARRLNQEAQGDSASSGNETVAARAAQQREWLEEYGGIATRSGDTSGRGIPLAELFNDKVGRISGATYHCREIDDLDEALAEVARILRTGYDVPLCLSWVRPESSSNAYNHFVLALAVRGSGDATEFQIYEPWTGKTAWVSIEALRGNTLQPILNRYQRITHFYEPLPIHSEERFKLASAAAR